MADIQLPHLREGGDGADIVERQPMAGVAFQAEFLGQRRGGAQPVQLAGAALGIGAGMQFHHRRAERGGGAQLRRVGIDEQRDADAGRTQGGDRRAQRVELAGGIQPALGRDFLPAFGDQAGGVRAGGAGDADHFLGRRHFQVDRCLQGGHRALQVVVADVPPVLAQMHGDAVRAGRERHARGVHRIGMRPAARVAHGGDVVDVQA
jgi:hypothetical protein